MTSKFALLAIVGVAGFLGAASPADAACGAISGSGSAPNPANFDPPRRYDMVTLAKAHAVGAWKKQVRASCPGYSTSWPSARGRNLSCEGYAGGTSCVATGTPRK